MGPVTDPGRGWKLPPQLLLLRRVPATPSLRRPPGQVVGNNEGIVHSATPPRTQRRIHRSPPLPRVSRPRVQRIRVTQLRVTLWDAVPPTRSRRGMSRSSLDDRDLSGRDARSSRYSETRPDPRVIALPGANATESLHTRGPDPSLSSLLPPHIYKGDDGGF